MTPLALDAIEALAKLAAPELGDVWTVETGGDWETGPTPYIHIEGREHFHHDGNDSNTVLTAHTTLAATYASTMSPATILALCARMRLLEQVAEAAKAVAGKWEGAQCIVDPPCGNCNPCRLSSALAALDAETKP